MADKYAQSSGNWSNGGAGGIWYDAPSGGAPVSQPTTGDTAYLLGGVTVTLDEDVACDAIAARSGASGSWTTGKLSLPSGMRTIDCPVMRPGTDTLLTLSSGTGTLRINGTIYGSRASSKYGIHITATGWTVEPTAGGELHAVGSDAAVGGEAVLLMAAGSTVRLTSATGGSAWGRVAARIGAAGAQMEVGTVTGGSGSWTYGIQDGGGIVKIGLLVGGSGAGAHGLYTNSYYANVEVDIAKGGTNASAGAVYPGIGGNIDILSIDPTGVGPIIGGGNIRLAPGVRLPLFDLDGNRREWISSAEAGRGMIGALR